MRIKIIRVIIACLFLLILVELIYVQVLRGEYYFNLSSNNRIRVIPLEAFRGRILDRNGKIMAENRNSYNVLVTPQDINDQNLLFVFLSEVLDMEKDVLVKRYTKKKYTPFTPVSLAEDVSKEQAIVIEENRYRYPSIFVQESFKRVYPMKRVSAHVLGYVGKINRSKMERLKEYGYSPQSIVGYSGVEEFYDTFLKGESGGLQIEVNSRGRQVRLLSLKESQKGQDIVLTIDQDIQEITSELLFGKNGSIVILDVENGEVLGLVSSPSYDPNIFYDSNSLKKVSAMFANKNAPFLNRAIKGAFPPGSVFKIPVALCALESKKITQFTTFDCPGYYDYGGRRFGCTHSHGSQNLIESITHSCNVYYYHLARILGADMIGKFAKRLGLGKLTHIDLPYEKKGNIPNRRHGLLRRARRWYGGDTLNLAIGQGDVLATPLQLAKMMATIAHNGIEVQPHVIRSIGGQELEKYHFQNDLHIDKNNLRIIQNALRSTVSQYSGTANVLNISGMQVFGKTGTAQSSGDKDHHAWFAGYVKSKGKDLAFCVFLEHGGSSQNANILARQMLIQMQSRGLI